MANKIQLQGELFDLPEKSLALIFKASETPDVEAYPERVALSMEHCLYHADRVQVFDPHTPLLVQIVFDKYKGEITPDICRERGLAWRHVAGRIDLTLKLFAQGTPVAWVYPEAGLHPAACANLGDVAIYFTKKAEEGTTDEA